MRTSQALQACLVQYNWSCQRLRLLDLFRVRCAKGDGIRGCCGQLFVPVLDEVALVAAETGHGKAPGFDGSSVVWQVFVEGLLLDGAHDCHGDVGDGIGH